MTKFGLYSYSIITSVLGLLENRASKMLIVGEFFGDATFIVSFFYSPF
jgi:hypothetical protein